MVLFSTWSLLESPTITRAVATAILYARSSLPGTNAGYAASVLDRCLLAGPSVSVPVLLLLALLPSPLSEADESSESSAARRALFLAHIAGSQVAPCSLLAHPGHGSSAVLCPSASPLKAALCKTREGRLLWRSRGRSV